MVLLTPCLINNPVNINSIADDNALTESYLSVDHNITELISCDKDCSMNGNFIIMRNVITKLYARNGNHKVVSLYIIACIVGIITEYIAGYLQFIL